MAAYEVMLAEAIDLWESLGRATEELLDLLETARHRFSPVCCPPSVEDNRRRTRIFAARRLLRSYPATERLLAAEM